MAAIGTDDAVFYRRWILANGWAEAAGLGTTFVLGREVAPSLERATRAATVILGAVVAVLLGLILEVLSWAWPKRPSFAGVLWLFKEGVGSSPPRLARVSRGLSE